MPLNRRQILSFTAASAVAQMLPPRAFAGNYPTQPVRVIVGFPAGGGADVLTRIIAEWLQARLGQPFIVENRPGAATHVATEAVVPPPQMAIRCSRPPRATSSTARSIPT